MEAPDYSALAKAGFIYEGHDQEIIKRLHYNKPQLRSLLIGANEETAIWGRGTGKSTGLIAPRSIECIFAMPRSRGAFVGETYLQLMERTLPPVIQGWEEMGYKRGPDGDFVVCVQPPKEWPRPYIGPLKPDHTIFWKNGTVISLISQDRPGTSNGMSIDWIVGDEAKLLNKERLDNELLPTNRGNERYFRGIPEHHSVLWASDMPTSPKSKWLLDTEKQVDKELIRMILAVCVGMYKARMKGNAATFNRLKKQRDQLRAMAVFSSRASTLDNIEVLGLKYIQRLKRTLPELVFQTAVLNMPLTQVENGFYAMLDEDYHCYQDSDTIDYNYIDSLQLYLPGQGSISDCRKDADLDRSRPLSMSMDYQASIIPMVIGQRFGQYFRFQNAMYVLHPLRIKDMCREFLNYYKHYPTKELNYYYDHTSIGRGNASNDYSYSDEVYDLLDKGGWQVNMKGMGHTPSPYSRYMLWGYSLSGDDDRFLQPRFNKTNCKYLLLSMQQTEVKQFGDEFRKNKAGERKLTLDQRETPHFSDAADNLLWGENEQYMRGDSTLLETMFLK